jgi:hypothetical protein
MGGRLVVAAFLAAAAGCQGSDSLGGPGKTGSGGTTGTGGGAGGYPMPTGTGGTATGGTGCGGSNVQSGPLKPIPPNVLILMDRSASMNGDADGASCPGGCGASSKWSVLTAAVENLMAQYPQIHWGLALYGSDDACGVGIGPVVGNAAGTAGMISAALAATTLGGEAPTGDAVTNAVADLEMVTDELPRELLLVSDGHSGCFGDAGTSEAVTTIGLTWSEDQFPTFVLGPAPGADTTASAALEQMAEAGGEPGPIAGRAYYTPTEIGPGFAPLVSCMLAVPLLPDGVSEVAVSVTLDGQPTKVPQDPTNGWTFRNSAMQAIILHGSYCAAVTSGTATDVTFFYVCDSAGPITIGG